MKNLLYCCVFYNEGYLKLLDLLLNSLDHFSNIDFKNTDILVCTSDKFKSKIKNNDIIKKLNINFYTFDADNLYDACCARLKIFHYKNIDIYEKILYIDTDILITGDINKIFQLNLEKKNK